jgi:agmatinase
VEEEPDAVAATRHRCYHRAMTDRLMPADWQRGPYFGSPYTFMRIPATRDLSYADVAIIGLPLDIGTTHRPGTRYGPRAIRDISTQLFPHDLEQASLMPPFSQLRVVDYGDIDTYPGYIEQSLQKFEEELNPVLEAGVFPICLGGDHTVTLPVLRAAAHKHGTLSLVHFDSHPDFWGGEFGRRYHHGTLFNVALEEGLIDPTTSVQVGIRGSISATILGQARAAGFQVITADEFAGQGVDATLEVVRRIATRPTYVSLDIDSVDPAFAPGTGTPEVAGLTSREIVEMMRGLRGLPLVGFDVVEVSPPYDSSEITALLAANLVYELLMVLADPQQA